MPLPFLATFLINTAISIGLSVVASKIQEKQTKKALEEQLKESGGAILDIEYGEATPRQVAIGKCAVRGLAVYDQTFGEANFRLQRVMKLSDFYTSGMTRVAIDGEWVSLGTEHEVLGFPVASGDYAGLIWIKYYPGNQLSADFYLASNGRWPASGFGYAVSYAIITLDYNAEKLSSIPEIVIEFLGAPLYDFRKDSTAGGSGSHRWNDVSTWEYSANPIVADYNYRRGIYTGVWGSGHDIFMGMGMAESELNFNRYKTAADICDQTVEGENRYVVSLILDANREHGDNIEDLMLACAGMVVESVDGSYPILGASQTPVATLTDDDLIVGEPIEFRRYRPMNEVVNTVFGTYIEPNFVYANTGYTEQTTSGATSFDRRTLDFQLNLPMVPSKRQAEQLASIYFSENRYEARKTVTVREKWQVLEVGDWINWTNDKDGSANRVYQIVGMTIAGYGEDKPRTVTLNLQERNALIYAGIGPVTPPTPIARNGAPQYLQEVQGLEVTAIYVGDGAVYPGIRVQWVPVTDPTVDQIKIEWQPTGDDTRRVSKLMDGTATVAILEEGVVGSTEYQVRTTIVPDPRRVTTPSAWTTVTTLPLGTFVGPDQVIVNAINETHILAESITEEKLANAAVSERAMQDAAASFRTMATDMVAMLEQYRADIYGISRADLTGSGIPSSSVPGVPVRPRGTRSPIATTEGIIDALYQIRNKRQIEAKFGNAIASLAEEETVQVAIDSAIAALSQTLQASIGANTAAIESEAVARSTGDDALAAEILALSATIPDEEITTASFLQEIATRAAADEALSSRIVEQSSVLGITEAIIGTLKAKADVKREQTARSTSDLAISSLIDALTATVETNLATVTASLETEQTARASADEALSTDLAALTASVSFGNEVINASLNSERTARANADGALAQDISALSATVTTNNSTLTASIATEASARATADDALAADITALTSTVGDNTAAITAEATTRASADTVLANDITALESSLTDAETDIATNATAISSLDTRVTTAEGTITSQGSSLTAVQSELTTARGGQANLDARLDGIDTTVASKASSSALSALDSRVTTAEGTITSQGTALTSVQAEITTARSGQASLDTRLDGIDTTVASKASSSALSALDARVTTAEGTITSQGTAITGLESDLADAESDIAGNASAISGLDTRVTAAEGTITSQGSALTSVQSEITTARNGQASLDTRLDGIDTTVASKASSSALSALDSRVTSAEGTISSQGTAITSVQSEITTARGGQANLDTRLDGIDSSVASKASSSALSALDARVTTAEGTITSQGSAITTLQSDVNDVEADVASNVTAISGLDTRVTSAEGTISSQGTALTSVQNEITTARAGEASLDGRLDAIDTEVASKASSSALSSLDSRVTTAEGTITSQGSAITSVTAEVTGARGGEASLDARLDALDTNLATKASASALTTLDARVDDIEGDVTAQATAITTVEAVANNASASNTFAMSAYAGPSGVTARFGAFIRATTADGYVSAPAFYIDLIDNDSQFVIAANRTVMADASGNKYALFDATGAHINGNLIADGTIYAPSIVAGTITANEIQAAGISTLHSVAWTGVDDYASATPKYGGNGLGITMPSYPAVLITAEITGGAVSNFAWAGFLTRNGAAITPIKYMPPIVVGGTYRLNSTTIFAIDYPPPGSTTYALQFYADSGGGLVTTRSVYLYAVVIRR